jgi:hypothetical protein
VFSSPLGLLALLAIPAIVGLHYYRRRFRPHVVSAVFLWADDDTTPLSGRKRERLRNSWSLWSELAAALLLALLLAGPRGCEGRSGTHLVVVVDGSASMGATTPSGPTLLARATEEIEKRIAALGRGSRVTLIASGLHPRILAGPAAFPEEALRVLHGFEPTARHHDLTAAVALGLQLSGGGSVVCLTDRYRPDDFQKEVELVAIGEPIDNVAIVRATRSSARKDAGEAQERLFVTIASFASSSRETRISAVDRSGHDVLASDMVKLAPGERKSMAFDLPRSDAAIEVRLDPDALAIDDHAFVAAHPKRTVTVRSGLPEEVARELGLVSNDGVRVGRWLALVDDAVEAQSDDAAHVLIADHDAGGPATWTLRLLNEGTERKDFIGPFLAEKRHPLLEGTTLEGIVWSTNPNPTLSGVPLIAAGNLPLLAEERQGAKRTYFLALDPKRSSLQRSPDWPILLTNLLEERRRELPGPVATNVALGEEITFRATVLPDSSEPYVLEGPGTKREIVARPVTVIEGVDAPGFYDLKQHGDVLATFGASFQDAAESDLSNLGSGVRPSQAASAAAAPTSSWLEIALLGAVIVCLLVDWFALARPGRRSGLPAPTASVG